MNRDKIRLIILLIIAVLIEITIIVLGVKIFIYDPLNTEIEALQAQVNTLSTQIFMTGHFFLR